VKVSRFNLARGLKQKAPGGRLQIVQFPHADTAGGLANRSESKRKRWRLRCSYKMMMMMMMMRRRLICDLGKKLLLWREDGCDPDGGPRGEMFE